MNANLPDDHSSVYYYDGDYPGQAISPFPENFDPATLDQGIAYDVDRYQELADDLGGDRCSSFCCGTGRVAIPLARRGFSVTGLDISERCWTVFARTSDGKSRPSRSGSRWCGRHREFRPRRKVRAGHRRLQQPALRDSVRGPVRGARRGGTAPRRERQPRDRRDEPAGSPVARGPVPGPFVTRRNPHTGNPYTRFAALGPLGADQVQELFGWYDEVAPDGLVRRAAYSLHWRPIFRRELELMLERAGLEVESIAGGHHREPFTPRSQRMFVVARQRG